MVCGLERLGESRNSIVSIIHRKTACRSRKRSESDIIQVIQLLHASQLKGATQSSGDWYHPEKIMNTAASNGLLKLEQWLHMNKSGGYTTKVMDLAAT